MAKGKSGLKKQFQKDTYNGGRHSLDRRAGTTVNGKGNIKLLWTEYFLRFPDHSIELTRLHTNGNWVAGFGFVHAVTWQLPVALSAFIQNAKIKEWHVYSDTKIPFERMTQAEKMYQPGIRGLA